MTKLKPLVIGATGMAGQNLVLFLLDHPWFDLPDLAASERSAGKLYKDAIAGRDFFAKLSKQTPPNEIMEAVVLNTGRVNPADYDLVFSAIDLEKEEDMRAVEGRFAKHMPVISTTKAFRYFDDVPILVPGVNSEHVKLLEVQKKNRGWDGFVVPEPNCTTTGLVTTLKPLDMAFGLQAVIIDSRQALSGAGAKGIEENNKYRLDSLKNVRPHIPKEEKKVRDETKKILGKYEEGRIINADIKVDCTCNRVDVENVHTESVYVFLREEPTTDEVKNVLKDYKADYLGLNLPSAPKQLIIVDGREDMPQPRLHIEEYGRMSTAVGRIRRGEVADIEYVLTSDNTGMGAGGGAVLIAEYLKAVWMI